MPFPRATNFTNGLKRKLEETIFTNLHWYLASLQSAIRVTIKFLLIFGETIFVEVPKIHEIREVCSPQKVCPTVTIAQQTAVGLWSDFILELV